MIKYQIIVTQRALSDISECVLFVNNVSKDAGKKLYQEIISKIYSLENYPNSFPEIDGLTICGAKIRRMSIHSGRYLILYKVESNAVVIYDIIDSRRDNSILKI